MSGSHVGASYSPCRNTLKLPWHQTGFQILSYPFISFQILSLIEHPPLQLIFPISSESICAHLCRFRTTDILCSATVDHVGSSHSPCRNAFTTRLPRHLTGSHVGTSHSPCRNTLKLPGHLTGLSFSSDHHHHLLFSDDTSSAPLYCFQTTHLVSLLSVSTGQGSTDTLRRGTSVPR